MGESLASWELSKFGIAAEPRPRMGGNFGKGARPRMGAEKLSRRGLRMGAEKQSRGRPRIEKWRVAGGGGPRPGLRVNRGQ